MSISIKLYSFSKYENSTKVPSGSAGTTYNGVLIEPCSVLNPVIKVNGINGYSYNYAYISTFSRYYFITDWETQDGFWYLTLRVDPMGSFKTTIGSSTQFVERAAGVQDVYLVDTMYPTTGKFTSSVVELEEGLASYLPDGWFVLNITGSTNNMGSYACDWHTFVNVVKEMVLRYDDDSWWANLCDGVRNSVYQPFKHLGSVIWFPYDYIDVSNSTSTHTLYLGPTYLDGSGIHGGEYDMTFHYLDIPSIYTSDNETLPKHPEAATHGKYMNLRPFSKYIYRDCTFGDIELDAAKLIDKSTVAISKITDPATGVQVLNLPDGQTRISQVGVLIPMENNSLNIGGFLSTAASTVASFLVNPVAGTANTAAKVAGAAAGAVAATDSLLPTVTSTSQMGATVLTWQATTIDCYFWETTGHDPTNKGKLYCKTKQINTLSGYVQTSDAHISSTSMSTSEQDMITSIMDSGFYYE